MIKEESNLRNLKEDEFLRGERPDGSIIGIYRNLFYGQQKNRKNPLAGFLHVDLIDTGAFVNSSRLLKQQAGIYRFGFTDSKAPDLLERYGRDIAGLSQETFNKFQIDIIKPRFVRKIKNSLGQR